MRNDSLDSLFSPHSIALVGASTKLGSVGNDIAKNLLHGGFIGEVFPVNPNATELYGTRCYPDLTSIGSVPDLVIIAIPAASVPDILRQAAGLHIPAAIIISAGFRETGEAGAKLESEIAEIAHSTGIIVLGPNCLGFLNSKLHLNASFAPRLPRRGPVGFLSQSGALMTAVLDLSEGKIGFSKFVSTGNKTTLDEKDFLAYLALDPETRVIAFYAEGLSDAPALIALGRNILAHPQTKPIVALKSGRTESGMRASGSHTGSLAGTDAAYDALFRQARILRADSIRGFLDTLSVLSANPVPNGPRVAIVTNAGGLGVIAADAATKAGLSILPLSKKTTDILKPLLPVAASVGNPIDLLGDARSDRYRIAIDAAVNDPDTDAVIVILTPQSMTEADETARAIAQTKRDCGKPVLAVFAGGHALEHGTTILREAGVSVFTYPEEAVEALGLLARISNWKTKRFTPKRDFHDIDRTRVSAIVSTVTAEGRTQFTEQETRETLEAYGFPILKSRFAANAEDAANEAEKIGGRVALKIASQDIVHKTDAGGVMLDVRPEEVRERFTELLDRVRTKKPDAKIDGVTVMEMGVPDGRELILGVKHEPGLGSLLLIGMGGIYTEILHDVAFRFAPLVPEDAEEMLSELRSYPILRGARGEDGIDMGPVMECLERLSRLVEDFPEITELDINPLSTHGDKSLTRILDARIAIR